MAKKKEKEKADRRLFGLRLREELVIELRHAALDLKIPANQLMEEASQATVKAMRADAITGAVIKVVEAAGGKTA